MRTALQGARKGLAMQFFYIQKKRPCVLLKTSLRLVSNAEEF